MQARKRCGICGNLFIDRSPGENRKYCSKECRRKANAMAVKARNDKANAEKRKKICRWCQKEFWDDSKMNQRRYCSEECSHQASKEKQKAWHAQNRKKPFGGYRKSEPKPTQEKGISSMTMEEVQRAARAAGMSYGKYVAMMGNK